MRHTLIFPQPHPQAREERGEEFDPIVYVNDVAAEAKRAVEFVIKLFKKGYGVNILSLSHSAQLTQRNRPLGQREAASCAASKT